MKPEPLIPLHFIEACIYLLLKYLTFMEKTSDLYPRLYHYTNEQGLYGILENRCIWATHYKFLNDYSEIELFRDKLARFLYPQELESFKELFSKSLKNQKCIVETIGLSALAEDNCKAIIEQFYNSLTDEVYIASFCAEHPDDYINQNGLLSQWRGYGGDGGYAIVFNTCGLEEMGQSEVKAFRYDCLHLADVIYSDDDEQYHTELSEPLHTIASNYIAWKMHIRHRKEEPSDLDNAVAYRSFVQCITRFKHRGFKEEKEVRMVATLVPFNKIHPEIIDKISQGITGYEHYKSKPEKERKFRTKNGRQMPYIELFRSLGNPLPIEKIIVGPHKDKEARAAALRVNLRDTDIEVAVSEIPYIG